MSQIVSLNANQANLFPLLLSASCCCFFVVDFEVAQLARTAPSWLGGGFVLNVTKTSIDKIIKAKLRN